MACFDGRPVHPPSPGQEAPLQEASTIFTSSGGRIEGTMAKRKQMPTPRPSLGGCPTPPPVVSPIPAAKSPSGVKGQSEVGSQCAL